MRLKKQYNIDISEAGKLASEIVSELAGGETLALIGDLGAGKTTFTKLLAEHLKVKSNIISPTFVIHTQHKATLPKNNKKVELNHLDVYRFKHEDELLQLGILEKMNDSSSVTIIEWADKVKTLLPKNTIYINIRNQNSNEGKK